MSSPIEPTSENATSSVCFRNYVPHEEKLRVFVQRISSVPSRDLGAQLNEARVRARALPGDDKPVLVAPKRVNWDLKRDVDKRLKKLAKRTQNAISQLAEELQGDREED